MSDKQQNFGQMPTDEAALRKRAEEKICGMYRIAGNNSGINKFYHMR